METLTLIFKVSKIQFLLHSRALPFHFLVEGYLLLHFKPQFQLGNPEPLILHLTQTILWLMDGTLFKTTHPLHNRQQGATPPSHMGTWGQVPLIPKLVLLVLRLDLSFIS